jgi:hypothetical protein
MPPVKATAAPLATQAATKQTTPATTAKPIQAKTNAPAVTSTSASPRITFGDQVREFFGIVEEAEAPPAAKAEHKADCTASSKVHCTSCPKDCGKEFCLGCWCEGHLDRVRKELGCCDSCCGGGDFIAGVTFFWVQPNFEANPAYIVQNTAGQQVARVDYRYHVELSPQFWIGYVGDSGLGGRLTWWQFDRSSSTEALLVPVNTIVSVPFGTLFQGDSLTTSSRLTLNVIDLEATQDLRLQQWVLVASGGLRYAHMSQDSWHFFQNAGPTFSSTISHNFNGMGPTIALAARRLLGDSGLALYGLSRGAVLFGTGKQRSYLFDPLDNDVLEIAAAQADVLPVVEYELGAEYGRPMGNFRVFGQAGIAGSCWFGAGNASSDLAQHLLLGDTVNLGFNGFYLRAGVGY